MIDKTHHGEISPFSTSSAEVGRFDGVIVNGGRVDSACGGVNGGRVDSVGGGEGGFVTGLGLSVNSISIKEVGVGDSGKSPKLLNVFVPAAKLAPRAPLLPSGGVVALAAFFLPIVGDDRSRV